VLSILLWCEPGSGRGPSTRPMFHNGCVDGDDRKSSGNHRVWIFHGETGRFASGVFSDRETGLEWVARHGLTGVLTEYEVGNGCYDLAVQQGRFRKTVPHHGSPDHVARFSPGLDHIHVRDGRRAT
jgi:hypothetical protein